MYSIGELSKIVKISADTLRYYDEINLVKPERVDESNRYRYYSQDQVGQLFFILELKEYGFSLDAIRELLLNGVIIDQGRLKLALNSRLRQLLAEQKQLNEIVASVNQRIAELERDESGQMGRNLLLIDDASFMRFILRDIVEKSGYFVIGEAIDGKDGVTKYLETKPDMVIMDIRMPEMDGVTATKKIREIDPQAKIVVLSAHCSWPTVLDCLDAGAIDFVVKPFQQRILLDALNNISNRQYPYNRKSLEAIREVYSKKDQTMEETLSQEVIARLLQLIAQDYTPRIVEELTEMLQR